MEMVRVKNPNPKRRPPPIEVNHHTEAALESVNAELICMKERVHKLETVVLNLCEKLPKPCSCDGCMRPSTPALPEATVFGPPSPLEEGEIEPQTQPETKKTKTCAA